VSITRRACAVSSSRNKHWEAILDRLIHLRQIEKLHVGFIIQVDTLCHKLPNFVRKCALAGARRVFIGLENINPDNLIGAKKRQNKITEYREMLLAWKSARVITYAGYILGFPNDTEGSILRDIDVIKRELPVDLLEFFYLTPLPGSEDHLKLFRVGAPLARPEQVRPQSRMYGTPPYDQRGVAASVQTCMAALLYVRAHGDGAPSRGIGRRERQQCFVFDDVVQGQHRLRKHTSSRGWLSAAEVSPRSASGWSIESVWRFYPRYCFELAIKLVRWCALYLRLRRIYLRIRRDPRRTEYMDLAMISITDEEVTREIFQTKAAQAYLGQRRRLADARQGAVT
jgi:hypothetical protein